MNESPGTAEAQVSTGPARLAVIIPMFNEELGAARCIQAVCNVLRSSLPDSKLFVVNDGSSDKTEEVVKALESREPLLKVVSYARNMGYGAALLQGAKAAREAGFDFGLYMDSDLTNNPALIPIFAKAVQADVDVVKASRYIANGGMQGVPLYRQLISRCGNTLASFLCGIGIRDCTNGFRAVRLSLLEGLSFTERGFPSIMEELFLLKSKGARFTEIPYTLTSRTGDQKGSSFRYNVRTFYRYLRYCVLASFVRSE